MVIIDGYIRSDTPLMPEDHHLYRKGRGVLLYLAPETPDFLFTLKSPSMKLASPTEGDVELLRLIRKYLKGCPDIHLLHKTRNVPGVVLKKFEISAE